MLSLGTLLRGPITFQLSTLETVLQYVNAGKKPSPATAGLFLFGWAGAKPWPSHSWQQVAQQLQPLGSAEGVSAILERAGWVWRAERSSGARAPACQEKARDNRTHATLC